MIENKIIDGKEIASKLREKIKILGEEFKKSNFNNPRISCGLSRRKSSQQSLC